MLVAFIREKTEISRGCEASVWINTNVFSTFSLHPPSKPAPDHLERPKHQASSEKL